MRRPPPYQASLAPGGRTAIVRVPAALRRLEDADKPKDTPSEADCPEDDNDAEDRRRREQIRWE